MVWIEGEPEERLKEVWAYISPEDAKWLLEALEIWFEDDPKDPDWHHHVGSPGSELTIAIGREASEGKIPGRPTTELT